MEQSKGQRIFAVIVLLVISAVLEFPITGIAKEAWTNRVYIGLLIPLVGQLLIIFLTFIAAFNVFDLLGMIGEGRDLN